MEKQDVKVWLKAIKKNREWLSDQCGLALTTMNGILYGKRPIPKQSGRLIERLMEQYPVGTSTSSIPDAPENTLVLTADESTFDAWNEAAAREGKLLRQWACDVLTEQAGK